MPHIYMFSCSARVKGGARETNRWQKAVEKALRSHPIFSSRVDWKGRQYAVQKKDVLCGPYHQFAFRVERDDLLLDIQLGRILGDGRSIEILVEDINQAYRGEPLQQDDYWGYLEHVEQQKQSEHYRISRDWLAREFADESVPVHPTLDRCRWTLFPPKAGLYQSDYSDIHDAINHLSEAEFLSADGFFSLCTALAIAEYCGTDSAALTWAYEGRERPEEQRIFGSLHRDVPFLIKMKGERLKVKGDLIRQARNQIRSGIAHSDYPYTLISPYNKRWNYAVNVLRISGGEDWEKLLPPEVEFSPIDPMKYAYALLDVEIHESYEHLNIVYRYSASHYGEDSIKKFASLVRKYAEWLLKE